jgi:hypothetical protein
MPAILADWEAQGQLRQKVCETPSQQIKADNSRAYHPSYIGSVTRRVSVLASLCIEQHPSLFRK